MLVYLSWTRAAGRAAFLAALAVYGLGCAADAEPDVSGDDSAAGGSGSGGSGGSGGQGLPAPVLELQIPDESGTLYTPGREETILREPHSETLVTVLASDGERIVRFALLPNDAPVASGDTVPGDAALDQTEVLTDSNGYGQVLLTAPGRPTTFLLRASAGTLASTQLRFSVQGMNQADLDVVPLYNGRREVERWTASATANTTCEELLGNQPSAGADEESAAGESVRLEDVPVGVPLAVAVRAEHFAWGCTNLATAVEGSAPERVEIVVTNVPIRLDQSRVELELGLDSLDGWVNSLAGPLPDTVGALRGKAADDVEALFDAMQASLSGPDYVLFSGTRTAEKWDTRARDALGERADAVLSAPFERWVTAGLGELRGERAFTGVLSPSDAAAGSAELELESVFGLDAADAGFTVVSRGSWTAQADVVLIGMKWEFRPSAFLVAAARAPAVGEVVDAKSVAGALSRLLPCSTVAAALVDYDGCDSGCREDLCQAGLKALVAQAAGAPLDVATLSVAASGDAGVGPHADLEALTGSWIGKLEVSAEEVDVGGSASATALAD